MAARVPAADALIVGLARHLTAIQARGPVDVDDRPDGAVPHAWTIWAHGFDDGDRTALAEDVLDYLAEPVVRGQLITFAAELASVGIDTEKRPAGEGTHG